MYRVHAKPIDNDLPWRLTRAAVNRVAGALGLPARLVFDDTLFADVARIQVRRELMREFPNLRPLEREALIVELTEDYDV